MKQTEAYLRAVRRGLADAPPEDRERLMKRLTEAVTAYLEEDPEAGEEDVVKAFGTPEACAAELMAECGPARVAAVRRKRRLLYGVIAALVVAAAVVLATLFLRSGTGIPHAAAPDAGIMDSGPHTGHSSHESGHH